MRWGTVFRQPNHGIFLWGIATVIASFANKGTENVFDGENTKAARKVCPTHLFPAAREALDVLTYAMSLQDLKGLGYGLHKLHRERAGQWAIKINKQYRVCFVWASDGPRDVEITDYH
ncbi:MAG: type II toxin-antitoxin system RelE/ParE family toxin [Gammaproteobacteria bacterium]|nr:type II toxin-antitoxin system RelE/ParE family toxin [Gammaproteobacteria bacterium]